MKNVKNHGWLIGLWLIGILAVILIPAVWDRESRFMGALFAVVAVGTVLAAGLLTWSYRRLRQPAGTGQRQAHEYLSTGCLHGEHAYCQSMTGYQGEKRPGRCKFCDAQCSCSCHMEAGL
ncbi:hypothetical protein [Streptomyces sp. NPDC046821]|uniref:hypothetical protein n=1 Tax=Streptomyces sp. NPDC046821 TaxID=3154702 RepID=UPI0033E16F35